MSYINEVLAEYSSIWACLQGLSTIVALFALWCAVIVPKKERDHSRLEKLAGIRNAALHSHRLIVARIAEIDRGFNIEYSRSEFGVCLKELDDIRIEEIDPSMLSQWVVSMRYMDTLMIEYIDKKPNPNVGLVEIERRSHEAMNSLDHYLRDRGVKFNNDGFAYA